MNKTLNIVLKSLFGTILFGAVLVGTAYAAGSFDTADDRSRNCCSDGVDNDCDGLVDCDDSDCANVGACRCIDTDGDGYYASSGCGTELDPNDNNSSIVPGVADVPDDEIEDDVCVECDVCNKLKQECLDTCTEIKSSSSNAICDKFWGSGCGLDFTGCGGRACSYAYEQYYCKKPGYLECIQPKMEEYLSCISNCNQEYIAGRTESNWQEMREQRTQCKESCEGFWHSALYEECKPQACDAACKEQGYTGGSWERIRDGVWNSCWCDE